MAKFKQEVLNLIENDPLLFAAVANEMGIKPASLPNTLVRNGSTLNQYNIVKLVADHLGKKPEELLEDEPSEVKEV